MTILEVGRSDNRIGQSRYQEQEEIHQICISSLQLLDRKADFYRRKAEAHRKLSEAYDSLANLEEEEKLEEQKDQSESGEEDDIEEAADDAQASGAQNSDSHHNDGDSSDDDGLGDHASTPVKTEPTVDDLYRAESTRDEENDPREEVEHDSHSQDTNESQLAGWRTWRWVMEWDSWTLVLVMGLLMRMVRRLEVFLSNSMNPKPMELKVRV